MTAIQVIPIILSSIAITINLVFRYIDKKKKKLYYIIGNELLIENNKEINELTLTYENHTIHKLVKTELLIFNKNRKTIEFNELGKVEPLQLSFSKETKILSTNIIEFDNPNVNFGYKKNDNSVILNFDYFKRENYALLSIISDENSNTRPILLGEFIKDGEIVRFNRTKYFITEILRIIPIVFVGSVILMIIYKMLEFDSAYLPFIGLINGFLIVDIIKKLFDKKIDKRIITIIRNS